MAHSFTAAAITLTALWAIGNYFPNYYPAPTPKNSSTEKADDHARDVSYLRAHVSEMEGTIERLRIKLQFCECN